ncbi:trypsin-like serine peptidase [Kitasatospora indigofera]|uniref:trypsin-like serine peptidase n=1 Tax=Kitasatospora indigofera TaxID=67307 RepID=UPI003642164A
MSPVFRAARDQHAKSARTGRGARTARAALTTSVAALTLLAATACGPENSEPVPDGPPPASAAGTPGGGGAAAALHLPTLDELKSWKFEDWDKWAQQNVVKPAVAGYWNIQRMLDAKPPAQAPDAPAPSAKPTGQPSGQPSAKPSAKPADGGNDPRPARIEAKPVAHPFAKQFHVNGKVFFQSGGKDFVCSGTVISDPAHPGKSNLVWTAGHCTHEGKGAGYHENIVFAPAFNSTAALSGGKKGAIEQAEPYGEWGTVGAIVSPQWAGEAEPEGALNGSIHYDFSIIKVANPKAGGKSLEETVGGSVPVWFNAPRDQLSINTYGYPAAEPYDGVELETCAGGKPVRLSKDASRPPLLTVGCSNTGGSSGGGWFSTKDGKPALVSDTSIGNDEGGWQAGPYLDDVAAHALDFMSKK